LALSIERDELGIVAGLQDRATQAFAAPVLVDGDDVRVLRPARPLHFVVAWRPEAEGDSGHYHRTVVVDRAAMAELAPIARDAAAAFERGDADALAALMDASARTRQRAAPLSDAHEQLADAARRAGFRANSAGSGGAIVAVAEGDAERMDAPFVRVTIS
ncbi:MAG: glucuronokinase, partial [Actinomycetota bacterium]